MSGVIALMERLEFRRVGETKDAEEFKGRVSDEYLGGRTRDCQAQRTVVNRSYTD